MIANYIDNKEKWEILLDNWPSANFLQSWNWGTFQKSLNKNVYFLQVDQNCENKACALVVAEKAKRGNYLTIAGGPLVNWHNKDVRQLINCLLEELKVIARKENALFLRIRAQEETSLELSNLMNSLGFQKSPMHLTADLTLQLDLSKNEDVLLSEMRKNTRYEIKKADRLGIDVVFSKNLDEIKDFYKNQLDVAKKQKFIPFTYEFLKNQFASFLADDQVLLVHSSLNGKLLASAFIIFYRNEAVYHYGISTEANAKLPGSYACQWAAIKEAKRRGLKQYNFWGIAPKEKPDHRFAGVSIFKRGFGGQEVEYSQAHDYPFSKKYNLVRMFESLRKKLRKL